MLKGRTNLMINSLTGILQTIYTQTWYHNEKVRTTEQQKTGKNWKTILLQNDGLDYWQSLRLGSQANVEYEQKNGDIIFDMGVFKLEITP